MDEFVCEVACQNEDAVKLVKKRMPSEESLLSLADLFKAFSDVTRLKIITALSEQELCVCEICEVVGMMQSAVSHQLRYLTQMGVIGRRKEGKFVYYALKDHHIITIFMQGLAHIKC